jgi:hypothetical protein
MRSARNITSGAIAALLAAVFASSASAQLATGRSGSSTMSYIGAEQVWGELDSFGRCYARQNTKSALALIATDPGSADEARVYRKLFSKPYMSCLGDVTSLNAAHDMVRGAIAEGLLKKKVPIPASMTLAPPPPGRPGRTISEAARCYVAAHRDEAMALLDTPPGSKKELAAATEMLPEFDRCIPVTARALPLNSILVRYKLAEALLRLRPGVN